MVIDTSVPQPSITSLSPNSGLTSGGILVTVTGTNFLPGATVQFGANTAVTATFISGNQLTVTDPANPVGTVTVIVANTNGAYCTSTFTYQAAQQYIWTNLLGGAWSTAANWTNGLVGDGPVPSDFSTLNITSDTAVHLDTARTNAGLIFGDTVPSSAASWILDNSGNAANILTLGDTNSPTITVGALGKARASRLGCSSPAPMA